MAEDHVDLMRTYIFLAEEASASLHEETTQIVEDNTPQIEPVEPLIIHDLENLVFKLRGFMEASGGDYALGVESGMQQAADMVENLIRRYKEGDNLE